MPGRLQPHEREEQLRAAVGKVDRHLFAVRLQLVVAATGDASSRAFRKIHEIAGAFGQFTGPGLSTFRLGPIRRKSSPQHLSRNTSFLLSDEELATLWHPATQTVRTETMAMNVSRELEPPAVLPSGKEEGAAALGRVAFRDRRQVFGIRPDDRRRHVAIIGKTGMGKSTLLRQLIVSDIEAGRGVAFIDPHGDLAQIDDATRAAVFGNVGTLLSFQVGAGDAEFLAEQLGGDVTGQDLMMLPKYTAYVRLLLDGMPSRPFSMKTLPPRNGRRDRRRSEVIRRTSRRRYGNGAESAFRSHALQHPRAPVR